jgi:hypothetical protein
MALSHPARALARAHGRDTCWLRAALADADRHRQARGALAAVHAPVDSEVQHVKTGPTLDANDEGVVAWLKENDDGEPDYVAIDVATCFGPLQVGLSLTPERARRLAAELVELAEFVEANAITKVEGEVVQ